MTAELLDRTARAAQNSIVMLNLMQTYNSVRYLTPSASCVTCTHLHVHDLAILLHQLIMALALATIVNVALLHDQAAPPTDVDARQTNPKASQRLCQAWFLQTLPPYQGRVLMIAVVNGAITMQVFKGIDHIDQPPP